MTDDDLDLRSVNWSQGMFLTPEHFLRQERYVDSLVLWLLRFALPAHGLLGGGPRVASAELGAPGFDPVVDIDDAGDTLKVTVTQCRGVTAGGMLVDVRPSHALSACDGRTSTNMPPAVTPRHCVTVTLRVSPESSMSTTGSEPGAPSSAVGTRGPPPSSPCAGSAKRSSHSTSEST